MRGCTLFHALIALLVSISPASADQDVLTNPPTPICADGDFLWQQEVDVTNLDERGLPILELRLIRASSTSFVIPGPYPAEFGSAVTLSVDDTARIDALDATRRDTLVRRIRDGSTRYIH